MKDFDRLMAHFMEYGNHEGVLEATKLEYSLLAEKTRKEYNMSPEEYITGKGLNIKIEIL